MSCYWSEPPALAGGSTPCEYSEYPILRIGAQQQEKHTVVSCYWSEHALKIEARSNRLPMADTRHPLERYLEPNPCLLTTLPTPEAWATG